MCPFISFSEINFNTANALSNNIVEFLIVLIRNGHYIFLPCDYYYLSITELYNKNHFKHNIMVFGYDEEKKIFHVADFFNNCKFQLSTICFEEIKKATDSVVKILPPDYWLDIDSWNMIEIIKYKNVKYDFNIKILIKSIQDYLKSEYNILNYEENRLTDEEKILIENGNLVFGMKNYDLVKKFLFSLTLNSELVCDIRPLHALYDHKVMMLSRLNFLKENDYINSFDSIYKSFKIIEKYCLINRNLFIKYRITFDKTLIFKIITNIDVIMKEEKAAMFDLLSELEIAIKKL